MIGETVDIIGTAILFVAPFVLPLNVIVLVVAYPWLLLVTLGIWFLVVKYGPDEVAGATDAHVAEPVERQGDLLSDAAGITTGDPHHSISPMPH